METLCGSFYFWVLCASTVSAAYFSFYMALCYIVAFCVGKDERREQKMRFHLVAPLALI